MAVGKVIKALRREQDLSQLQLSFDLNVSRESISAYETERAKVPQDISRSLMEKFDNPFYAMEVAHDYTGGSWVSKLDGEAVDLHRSTVKDKTLEELDEALESIRGVRLATKPKYIQEHEKHQLEEAIIQAIDAIIALTHFVAIICIEYGFSWLKMWKKQHAKLRSKGYIKRRS
ncbi:helix-turn-helix domain-containing protein [Fictibacillus gelatini]|uniref:helix-turn-helix domain-containing protein n=1 Tax=Fictibacillus gelatini TaxID=225985 RepID=UPI0004047A55|nr:helix-turn-helix transcriptional regulator [Fictibacillus gelatini]